MNVFISWSGSVSRHIAKSLNDWLPTVLQSVRPFMSAEGIEKGARWLSQISTELEETHFGVICLTPDNVASPWIHFEAGSLAKIVGRSKVVPILFKLEPSEVQGPLTQFQMVNFSKTEMQDLLVSINNAAREAKIDDVRLERAFDAFWPQLDSEIRKSVGNIVLVPLQPPNREKSDDGGRPILEEILVLVRNLSVNSSGLEQLRMTIEERMRGELEKQSILIKEFADFTNKSRSFTRKEMMRLADEWGVVHRVCNDIVLRALASEKVRDKFAETLAKFDFYVQSLVRTWM